MHMRVHDRDVGVLLERHLAGQALIEDAAERVDVGTAIDTSALYLLRRDVAKRADELASVRVAGGSGDILREAEVRELAVLARRTVDHHVRRLYVTVYKPHGMRRI